ncbi:glycoside hydrolase family 105 protein [Polaribacter sp. Q13]|uniref:glycoside hydrolase family 88/105 protein n=1 Tax=Polaribacter sp. Q13 TaxID=2806551 RepID=UPI00193BB86C|nr:glycoside hydrolase family 88 protein [Polaribacter sp. Q13]QVY66588.1 glycoside hydrolase family 88 protein [Polaribacter sp. Q13]
MSIFKNNTFLLLLVLISAFQIQGQTEKQKEIKELLAKNADWQIEHFKDTYSRKKKHHPNHWTNGALYSGMVKWAALSEDDKYYDWLKNDIGNQQKWSYQHAHGYHADPHAVGQLYVDLYKKYKEDKMLAPTIELLDFIIKNPSNTSLAWESPNHQNRWNWCDALFMSPPLWAKLYNVTGDKKYLDFMVSEFKATTDFLFDKKESLYYRDERFIKQRDHDQKIFWARGNGWVFAGLVNIMNELNPKSKEYKYFLKIYKSMAKKLVKIQTEKGHWAMSLLGDEFYPTPETSGSSFFVYGLAWGVNNKILHKSKYKKAAIKGWNAMAGYVHENGMLGYVQPIGAAPGVASENVTEVYGTGAFLSAGTEMYKMYHK